MSTLQVWISTAAAEVVMKPLPSNSTGLLLTNNLNYDKVEPCHSSCHSRVKAPIISFGS